MNEDSWCFFGLQFDILSIYDALTKTIPTPSWKRKCEIVKKISLFGPICKEQKRLSTNTHASGLQHNNSLIKETPTQNSFEINYFVIELCP